MDEGKAKKLVEDGKILIHDVEGLVREKASQAGERIVDLRERLEKKVEGVRTALAGSERSQTTDETRARAENYQREKAWFAVALAAGVGLIIGLLLRRHD